MEQAKTLIYGHTKQLKRNERNIPKHCDYCSFLYSLLCYNFEMVSLKGWFCKTDAAQVVETKKPDTILRARWTSNRRQPNLILICVVFTPRNNNTAKQTLAVLTMAFCVGRVLEGAEHVCSPASSTCPAAFEGLKLTMYNLWVCCSAAQLDSAL